MSQPTNQSTIDGEQLRALMRSVASPVIVITTVVGENVWGITLGSFASVSLAPPLICFNISRSSRMHDFLLQAERYAIHLLGADDVSLSGRFSNPKRNAETMFEGLNLHTADDGLPLIQGTIGILLCKPFSRHDAGDSSLFLGEVIETRNLNPDKMPLLFYSRSYRTVSDIPITT